MKLLLDQSLTHKTPDTLEQVIERTMQFADWVGEYQRQLFLIDHAELPLEVVLNQIEILGTQVFPELRRRMEERRPDDVPSDPQATRSSKLTRSTRTF
ncbi:putative oxidoreductase [Corynebacterium diphtheriae]|nr:putative oxidoreductase [Corynebacterium diphtheriae]